MPSAVSATANVTPTDATALPDESAATTTGFGEATLPAVPLSVVVLEAARLTAGPAVNVNVAEVSPVYPVAVNLSTLLPFTPSSDSPLNVARPAVSVVAVNVPRSVGPVLFNPPVSTTPAVLTLDV